MMSLDWITATVVATLTLAAVIALTRWDLDSFRGARRSAVAVAAWPLVIALLAAAVLRLALIY